MTKNTIDLTTEQMMDLTTHSSTSPTPEDGDSDIFHDALDVEIESADGEIMQQSNHLRGLSELCQNTICMTKDGVTSPFQNEAQEILFTNPSNTSLGASSSSSTKFPWTFMAKAA